MIAGRGLVLDANILIRAALGRRVRFLLETYEDTIGFYTPDVCFEDAREYTYHRCLPVVVAIHKPAWPYSSRSGYSAKLWIEHCIWISNSSRGSEWLPAISTIGRLLQSL